MIKVFLFIFCIEQREEDRVAGNEVIENRTNSATFPARATTPSSFSKSASSLNDWVRERIGCDVRLHSGPLFDGKQSLDLPFVLRQSDNLAQLLVYVTHVLDEPGISFPGLGFNIFSIHT